MLRSGPLKERSRSSANKCGRHYLTVGMMIMVVCLTIVSGCSKDSVIFVDDSDRTILLDVNEPAPFRGILITEGRYEKLLDYEEALYEKD